MLSLSQATEAGTVYRVDEIRQLAYLESREFLLAKLAGGVAVLAGGVAVEAGGAAFFAGSGSGSGSSQLES